MDFTKEANLLALLAERKVHSAVLAASIQSALERAWREGLNSGLNAASTGPLKNIG